jgi:acetyl/propionyl-CoA carboxylase alpha subunit
MDFSFWHQNHEFKLKLTEKGKNVVQVLLGKKKYDVGVEFIDKDELLLKIDGKVYDVIVTSNFDSYEVRVNGKCIHIEKKLALQLLEGKSTPVKKREIKTFMPGQIVKIIALEGTEVKEGEAVLILEAMKMQNEIKSPQNGRITRIGPKVGDSVEAGTLLFVVE